MISFKRIEIKSLESYNNLKNAVPSQLIDMDVIKRLQNYLGLRCDEIRVEYPYYDSDYLSTYYIHYSQKLRPYGKLCCRLHILKEEEYYGYITLRPTAPGTKIGKTFLTPELLIRENAYLMLHNFKAHVVGNEMQIKSFPWKSQETDISVCAHTATWTITRYFGNKFRDYADATIGELVEHTNNDWGRKTPSLGLTPVQVSDLLKNYNFSPLILQREKGKEEGFLDDIIAYIESGIPMIGFLYPIKHAVSIIGHGLINYSILDNPEMLDMLKDTEINVLSHGRLIPDLYVMDDNYFPYRKVKELPSKETDTDYGLLELEYAVVPLYRRMQLTYSDVYERFKTWRKENAMDWEEFCICRIYIASANSLKQKAIESPNMSPILKDVILNMTFPRFVWCIDLAGIDNFKAGLTSGRIIVDTTAPTLESEPWLLRHDKNRIEFIDIENDDDATSNNFSMIKTEISPYTIYTNNLKEIHPI